MTTPKPLFKTGPAKLRDGSEAYIFEISDKIYLKVRDFAGWYVTTRSLDGSWDERPNLDLMPNNLPEVIEISDVEFELIEKHESFAVLKPRIALKLGFHTDKGVTYMSLPGKRWRMRLEEQVEES